MGEGRKALPRSGDSVANATGVANLTTGSSAQNTSAYTTHAKIRVVATQATWISIGNGVTASATTSMYLPANWPDYFHVNNGDRVSVLQVSSSGTVNIATMSE